MSAVPKFGSFKPKVALPSEEALLPERRRERTHDRSREPSSGTHGRRSHHSRHVDESSTHRPKLQPRTPTPGPQRDVVVEKEPEESNVFFVDRRGDLKNVEYGSLHRYSVPAYHRSGYGHLVGAPTNTKIDRDSSTQQSIVLFLDDRHGSRDNRPLLSGRSWPRQESKLRLVHAPSTVDVIETHSDFIALRAIRKRKRSGSPSEQEAAVEVDYRSIDGKAKASRGIADEDLEIASDHDLDDITIEQERRARHANAELIKETKERPSDAKAWLALIEHQAKVIYPDADASSLTTTEKRNLADVRLSLYDRALKHVGTDKPGREGLVLGYLREGGLIWEQSKLATKWTEALTQSPGSIELWTKYLDYVQTDHSNFTWEKCKAVYIQCLSILYNACNKSAGNERHSVNKAQIYVFLRLTAFVRDASYDELAYALWQLMLEKTFFRPPTLSGATGTIDELQDFWESEVPRIGEKDAQGWAHYAAHHDTGARHVTSTGPSQSGLAHSIASFAEKELDVLYGLHLPATSDDDSTDPFRHVMFSDMRESLEPLVDDLPRGELLNAFLMFMGWPMIPRNGETYPEASWEADQFLRTETVIRVSNPDIMSCSAVPNERHTTISLFTHAFTAVHSRANGAGSSGQHKVDFVDRVLERVVSASPQDDAIAEYYIAQRLESSTNEAAKTAKRLLKARPRSLRLYNAYALVVTRQAERMDKADEIWAMAIKMAPSLGDEITQDVVLLWHSWIATKMQHGHVEEALHLLLSMVDDDLRPKSDERQNLTATASKKLKAVRYFENGWEHMIYKHEYRHAILYAECHMWFDYLVTGLSLDAAAATCAKYDARLSRVEAPLAEELLLQAQASLCKTHIERHRPYRPALVRYQATSCISRFPQNSVFLDLYAQVQPHFQIEDRIRASLRSQMLGSSEATIITWSYAIAEESRRCTAEASGSMAHSVRSTFARALLDPSSTVSHSLALWTMWLRFEHAQGYDQVQPSKMRTEVQRKQAFQREKQVFLDGLRHLPWSKSWVIMGLQALARDDGMHTRELQQIYDVVAERELRVRVDVERLEGAATQQ